MTFFAGIAFAAVLPACASQNITLQRYRAALGKRWQHSYRLSGSDTGHRYAGYLGTREVRLLRWDGPLVQMWYDRPDAATHTFWNGFTGVARPWRKDLRLAADEVLTGRIASRQPTGMVCRRSHGRNYPVLTFTTGGRVRVEVSLDPGTSLPSSALSESETGQISLSNLRYAHADGGVVPTSWLDGGNRFQFTRIAHGDATAAPSNPARPVSIAVTARVPLVRNSRNPASRGVLVRIDGKPATLLVDTGNNLTVVSASAAKRLELRPVTQQYVNVAGGVEHLTVAIARTLDIGPAHMRDEPVAILPRTYGYDGAVGLALFARADASFRGDVMTLSPYAARGAHALSQDVAASGVPLDTFDGVPIVEGFIGRNTTEFVLDSGAAFAGLFPERFRAAGTKTAAGGTGCAISGLSAAQAPAMYRYDDVRVGTASLSIDACVTQFDEIGPQLRFPVLGFSGMFGPVRSLRYESARMTVTGEKAGASTANGARPSIQSRRAR